MRKIKLVQGDGLHAIMTDFHRLKPFDEAPEIVQGPGVRADAQCGSKNLLQRVILYRHKRILFSPGRQRANTQENYIWKSVGLLTIALDCCIRLGSLLMRA